MINKNTERMKTRIEINYVNHTVTLYDRDGEMKKFENNFTRDIDYVMGLTFGYLNNLEGVDIVNIHEDSTAIYQYDCRILHEDEKKEYLKNIKL